MGYKWAGEREGIGLITVLIRICFVASERNPGQIGSGRKENVQEG